MPNNRHHPKERPRNMLVTSALPYANGPLHLGHMVEFIQTDIWVRFQRLKGNRCFFVCGDDAHGTPIMLRAESLKMTPEALIAKYHQEHSEDLKNFLIEFNNFYTTHSDENRMLANEIYKRLKANGDIVSHTIRQAYDPVKKMFLPDRYVKGECPKCGAPDQYGDSCEVCGATYTPTELKNPVSVISGATPVEKESLHYFFCLDHYEKFLKLWTESGHLQPEVTKKLNEWFEAGLQQWDISRDAPYFGFEIEDAPQKYFYVWLDAPIGYMASFKNYCDQYDKLNQNAVNGHQLKPSFEEFWAENSQTELYHFIGKDIVYFHALFWPAMLKGSRFRTPTNIFVHGFLTVNGQKMSKSRGTFINARDYLNHLPPEYLRYYFAVKLGAGIEDIDFQLEDFVNRVNADLVGKLVNIASRCAGFITKKFEGSLSATCSNQDLYNRFVEVGDTISELYETREYRQAMREIMLLADEANRYIDEKKPWNLAKSEKEADNLETQAVCSLGINLFRVLMTYLQPVLPEVAKKVEEFLNCPLDWNGRKTPLLNHRINPFEPLLQRIELKQVSTMIEKNTDEMKSEVKKESSASAKASAKTAGESNATEKVKEKTNEKPTESAEKLPNGSEPIKSNINIDEFSKVDLRVAKILNAELIPEADKLIKLTVDVGGTSRQIFAGIKEAYPNPAVLIGKSVVIVANLEPRKMRFGLSEGMVLTSGVGGEKLWILEPNPEALSGSRIK